MEMHNQEKMKYLDKLQNDVNIRKANFNKISLTITTAETLLKKGCYEFFCKSFTRQGTLCWDEHRLIWEMESIKNGEYLKKPLIEYPISIRIKVMPYLEEFIESLLGEEYGNA